jgi:hypothetical protein
MRNSRLSQVGRAAAMCAALCFVPSAIALAEENAGNTAPSTGLGYGGAYWFGLVAGLLMFAVRYALDVRKSHLAQYGK